MSNRRKDTRWLDKLRADAIQLVNKSNAKFQPERRVSYLTAMEVIDRNLEMTVKSSPEVRAFSALRSLSAFISLATIAKTSMSSLNNADLLPVGHPMSTAPHAMTASALRHARARWIAADPLIDDSMRPLVATAHSLEPGSIERQHAFARLLAVGPKLVPITAAIDIAIADEDPQPIVAGILSLVGGNSRAARSARAKLQRRDRYGRFAFMGGGFSFKMKMKDGSFRSFSGRVVGRGSEDDAGSNLVEVELMRGSNGIKVAGQIVKVPTSRGTAVKAIIPQEGLEGLPDQGEVQPDDVFVSAAEMVPTKTGAPSSWTPTKKAKDFEGNEFSTEWESPDGYVVRGVGQYSHKEDYPNVGPGSAGRFINRQPQLQVSRKDLDFVDFPTVDTWAQVEDLVSRDQNDYEADIKKYNSLDGDDAAQQKWVEDQLSKGRADASKKPQILREESSEFADQFADAISDDRGIRFTSGGKDVTLFPESVEGNTVKGKDSDGNDQSFNFDDIQSPSEEVRAMFPQSKVDTRVLDRLARDLDREKARKERGDAKDAERAERARDRYDDLVNDPRNWEEQPEGFGGGRTKWVYVGPDLGGMLPPSDPPKSVLPDIFGEESKPQTAPSAGGPGKPPTTPPAPSAAGPLEPGESGPGWKSSEAARRGGDVTAWTHYPIDKETAPAHTITERRNDGPFKDGYEVWRMGYASGTPGDNTQVARVDTWDEAIKAIEADMPNVEKALAEKKQKDEDLQKRIEAAKVVPLGDPSEPGTKNPVDGFTRETWVSAPPGTVRMVDYNGDVGFFHEDDVYDAEKDGFRIQGGSRGEMRQVPKYRRSTGVTRDLLPFESRQQLENALNDALTRGNNIRFKYGTKEVTFQPASIYTNKKNGNRNVNGWSVGDNEERTYNLDKISPIAEPPKKVEVAPEPTPEPPTPSTPDAAEKKQAVDFDTFAQDADGTTARIQRAVDEKQQLRVNYKGKDRVIDPQRVWTNPKTGKELVTALDMSDGGKEKNFFTSEINAPSKKETEDTSVARLLDADEVKKAESAATAFSKKVDEDPKFAEFVRENINKGLSPDELVREYDALPGDKPFELLDLSVRAQTMELNRGDFMMTGESLHKVQGDPYQKTDDVAADIRKEAQYLFDKFIPGAEADVYASDERFDAVIDAELLDLKRISKEDADFLDRIKSAVFLFRQYTSGGMTNGLERDRAGSEAPTVDEAGREWYQVGGNAYWEKRDAEVEKDLEKYKGLLEERLANLKPVSPDDDYSALKVAKRNSLSAARSKLSDIKTAAPKERQARAEELRSVLNQAADAGLVPRDEISDMLNRKFESSIISLYETLADEDAAVDTIDRAVDQAQGLINRLFSEPQDWRGIPQPEPTILENWFWNFRTDQRNIIDYDGESIVIEAESMYRHPITGEMVLVAKDETGQRVYLRSSKINTSKDEPKNFTLPEYTGDPRSYLVPIVDEIISRAVVDATDLAKYNAAVEKLVESGDINDWVAGRLRKYADSLDDGGNGTIAQTNLLLDSIFSRSQYSSFEESNAANKLKRDPLDTLRVDLAWMDLQLPQVVKYNNEELDNNRRFSFLFRDPNTGDVVAAIPLKYEKDPESGAFNVTYLDKNDVDKGEQVIDLADVFPAILDTQKFAPEGSPVTEENDLTDVPQEELQSAIETAIASSSDVKFFYHEKERVVTPLDIVVNPKNNRPKLRGLEKETGIEKEFFLDKFSKPVSDALKQTELDSIMNMPQEDFDEFFDAVWPSTKDIAAKDPEIAGPMQFISRDVYEVQSAPPEYEAAVATLQEIDTKGSTAVLRAAWSPETQELYIQFASKDGKGGGIYRYDGVSAEFVRRFAASDSLGKMIPELKGMSKATKIDEFPGGDADVKEDPRFRQNAASNFIKAVDNLSSVVGRDFETYFGPGAEEPERGNRRLAADIVKRVDNIVNGVETAFSTPLSESERNRFVDGFRRELDDLLGRWSTALGEAWDASESSFEMPFADVEAALYEAADYDVFGDEMAFTVPSARKAPRKFIFDIGYGEDPEDLINRYEMDYGFSADLTGYEWNSGFPEVEVTVEDSSLDDEDLMQMLQLDPETYVSARKEGEKIVGGFYVDVDDFYGDEGGDFIEDPKDLQKWLKETATQAVGRIVRKGVVRFYGSPEELYYALSKATPDRVDEYMAKAVATRDSSLYIDRPYVDTLGDGARVETEDEQIFDEAAFDTFYDVPQGAYKVDVFNPYIPQGVVDDFDYGDDYTDDPKALASRFTPMELGRALREAVLPVRDGAFATGFGSLRFRNGDMPVPAEALYEALDSNLVSADVILAGLYDSGLPEDQRTNVDRAKDRAEAIQQSSQNKPSDDFTESVVTTPRSRRDQIAEAQKINGRIANPRSTYRPVALLDRWEEPNEKLTQLAERLKSIQDMMPDREEVGPLQILQEYLPLANSDDEDDRDVFRALWGMLISLDGGDSDELDLDIYEEGDFRDTVRQALESITGSPEAARDAYDSLLETYGGYPEFVAGRSRLADGQDDLTAQTTAALFYRLVKAASRPNEIPLWRSIGVAKSDPALEAYTTEGSVFDMDPRSFTAQDLTSGSFADIMFAPEGNEPVDRVIFVLDKGNGRTISAENLSSVTGELEHFGFGTYEVVSVKTSPSRFGREGTQDHVVKIRQVPSAPDRALDAPADPEPLKGVEIKNYGDISSWMEFEGQAGGNFGGFYKDDQGNGYYIKVAQSQSHADNELLATAFYRELGIAAPNQGYGMKDGELWLVSPLVSDKRGFSELLRDKEFMDAVREGFAVDAWLSNYDVAGLVYDNIVPDIDGNPVRIDNGGALRWRASGGDKLWWGDDPQEIDTMRDKDLARIESAYDVFGTMTEQDVAESAKQLLNISPSRIEEMVKSAVSDPDEAKSISDTLIRRREKILQRYGLDTVNPDEDILGEPTSLATSMGHAARDLQPGDVTAGDSFVIERVFHDADTPKGKVSVEGYFPGHELQRKEWNEWTVIDVFRGAPIPPKGDKPALHRPKRPFEPKPPAFRGAAAELLDGAASWSEVRDRLRAREIVFFDYETTGFPDREKGDFSTNKPVQLGAVKVVNGEVVDRFNIYMNPGEPLGLWSRENLKRDGDVLVTDDWLSGQTSKGDAHSRFVEWAGPDAIFAAHNAPFDMDVFESAAQEAGIDYRPAGIIDTLKLSQQFMPSSSQKVKPDPNGPLNHKLGTLINFFGGELPGWHTADADAEAVSRVLEGILGAISGKPLPDLAKDGEKYAADREKFEQARVEYAKNLLDYETAKAVAAAWNCGGGGGGGVTAAGTEYGDDCNVPSVDDIIRRATPDASDFVDPDGVHSGATDGSSSPLPDRGADNLEDYVIPFPENVDPAELFNGEKFMPTLQQQNIIAAWLTGENVVVLAKAGTGKTTTLTLGAKVFQKMFPGQKLLYIAYNRSVADEARTKFPPNTIVKTSDAIAYNFVKTQLPELFKKFSNKENALYNRLDIANYLGVSPVTIGPEKEDKFDEFELVTAIQEVVFKFLISSDPMLSDKHFEEAGIISDLYDAVMPAAQAYWTDIVSPDGKLPFAFSEMKKLWSLSRPDFTNLDSGVEAKIDVVMLDEAQDTNDAVGSVVLNQPGQVIMVGDPDQAIYQFNGAKDQLRNAVAPYRLPLTESWRYGPEIGGFANRFLALKERVHGEETNRGIGRGPKGEVVPTGTMDDADVVIVRSNAGAFGEILQEIEAGRTVGVTKSFYGDLKSFIESTEWLVGGGKASGKKRPTRMSEDLRPFNTWKDVENEAAKGEESSFGKKTQFLIESVTEGGVQALYDILSKIRQIESVSDAKKEMDKSAPKAPSEFMIPDELVPGTVAPLVEGIDARIEPTGIAITGKKTYDYKETIKSVGAKWDGTGKVWKIPAMNENARRIALEKLQKALRDLEGFGATPETIAAQGIDVVISTAHQMKGLEFGNVRVGGDFRGPRRNKNTGEIEWPKIEEFNLAYVTSTRAINKLDPGSLDWVYDHTGAGDENPFAKEATAPAPAEAPEVPEVQELPPPSIDEEPAPAPEPLPAPAESGGGTGDEEPPAPPAADGPSDDEKAAYDALDKAYYATSDKAAEDNNTDQGRAVAKKEMAEAKKKLKEVLSRNPGLAELINGVINELNTGRKYPEEVILDAQNALPDAFGRWTPTAEVSAPGAETSVDDTADVSSAPDVIESEAPVSADDILDLADAVPALNLEVIRDGFASADTGLNEIAEEMSKASNRSRLADVQKKVNDVLRDIISGDITIDDAYEKISKIIEDIPKYEVTSKDPDAINWEVAEDTISEILDAIETAKYGRRVRPDLPPPELTNKQGLPMGTSKNGILIEPGMRVRDANGYAGTVLEYNKSDWIGVFIRFDLDPRDPQKVKKGKWGPGITRAIRAANTVDVIGEDEAPWTMPDKVKKGADPTPADYDAQMEIYNRMIARRGQEGWSGEESERSDDGDDEGGGGGVSPTPSSPDDSGGDSPKAEAPEGAPEVPEEAAELARWDKAKPIQNPAQFLSDAEDNLWRDNSQYAKFIYKWEDKQSYDTYFTDGAYYYMDGGAEEVNAWLAGLESAAEGPKRDEQWLKAVVKTLDKLISLFPKTKKDMVVYRGVRRRREDDPLINLLDNLQPGDEFENVAYSSTSILESVAKAFSGKDEYLLEIVVPRGSRGLLVDPATGRKVEDEETYSNPESFSDLEAEFILPRNTSFKVLSREGNRIKVVVVQKEKDKAEDLTVRVDDESEIKVAEVNPEWQVMPPARSAAEIDTLFSDYYDAENFKAPDNWEDLEKDPRDKQISAAYDYTNEGYYYVNEALRNGFGEIKKESDRLAADRTVKGLDELFDSAPAIPEDMILYRGVRGDWADEVVKNYDVGDVFIDNGFSSTSADKDEANDWAKAAEEDGDTRAAVLEIVVPKGTKGVHINQFLGSGLTEHEGEQEVLLPRGTAFRVISKTEDENENVKTIRVAVVGQERPQYDGPIQTEVQPYQPLTLDQKVSFNDIQSWKKVGGQKGSNKGGTYSEKGTGKTYYVKEPKSEVHAQNEALASALYRELGIPAVEVHLGKEDGETRTVSPIVPNDGILGYDYSDETANEIRRGFAVDAWLANWDVVGLVFDNIIIDKYGRPVRVDPGGALMWRAQGEPKGGAFGDVAGEIDTLRDPEIAPEASVIFGDMTEEEIKESAKLLLNITPERIDEIVDAIVTDFETAADLKTKLKKRRQSILDRFGLTEKDKEVDTPIDAVQELLQDIEEPKEKPDNEGPMPVSRSSKAQDSEKVSNLKDRAAEIGTSVDVYFDENLDVDDVEQATNKFSLGKTQHMKASDAVIVRTGDAGIEVAMIEREYGPFRGAYALPGGMLDPGESFDDAADREMKEEVNIDAADATLRRSLGQVLDSPDWDPRFVNGASVGAVVYGVPEGTEILAQDDARSAQWVPVQDLADGKYPIAFGHATWLAEAFKDDPDLGPKFALLVEASKERNARLIEKINAVRSDLGEPTFTSYGDDAPNWNPTVSPGAGAPDAADKPLEIRKEEWRGAQLTVDEAGVTIARGLDYDDIYAIKAGTLDPPALPFFIPIDSDDDEDSGEGYYFAESGNRYWGRYGAAGALLRRRKADGTYEYLLAKRAAYISAGGGQWAWPGGAHKNKQNAAFSHETAREELSEELDIAPTSEPVAAHVNYVEPDWSYTTHIFDVTDDSDALSSLKMADGENTDAKWMSIDEIMRLRDEGKLHPAVADSIADVLEVSSKNTPAVEEKQGGRKYGPPDLYERVDGVTVAPVVDKKSGLQEKDSMLMALYRVEVPVEKLTDFAGWVFDDEEVAETQQDAADVLAEYLSDSQPDDVSRRAYVIPIDWEEDIEYTPNLAWSDDDFDWEDTGRKRVVPENPLPISQSAIDGTMSLTDAIERVKNTDTVAASAYVDGGDIEDLEVRSSIVVDKRTGEKKLSLRFKLTEWAAQNILGKLRNQRLQPPDNKTPRSVDGPLGDLPIEELPVYIMEQRVDPDTGNIIRSDDPAGLIALSATSMRPALYKGSIVRIDDSSGKTGAVFEIVDPKGDAQRHHIPPLSDPIETRPYVEDEPAGSYNHTVTILLPIDATEDQIAAAINAAGVRDVRAATDEDVKVLAENRLLQLFKRYTSHTNNPSGNVRDGILEKIEQERGVTADDVVVETDIYGRMTLLLPKDVGEKLARDLEISEFVHDINNFGVVRQYAQDAGVSLPGGAWNVDNGYMTEVVVDHVIRMLVDGSLKSTMTRLLEGNQQTGMSSAADIRNESGDYVFTKPVNEYTFDSPLRSHRMFNLTTTTLSFDAAKLMRRTDISGNREDDFGRKGREHDILGEIDLSDDPDVYEAIFKNEVDFSALKHVYVSSTVRDLVLSTMRELGITELYGRPIEDIVRYYGQEERESAIDDLLNANPKSKKSIDNVIKSVDDKAGNNVPSTHEMLWMFDVVSEASLGITQNKHFPVAPPDGSRILAVSDLTTSSPDLLVLEPSGSLWMYPSKEKHEGGSDLTTYQPKLVGIDQGLRELSELISDPGPSAEVFFDYIYGAKQGSVWKPGKNGDELWDPAKTPKHVPVGVVNHNLGEKTWKKSLESLLTALRLGEISSARARSILQYWAVSSISPEIRVELERVLSAIKSIDNAEHIKSILAAGSFNKSTTPTYVPSREHYLETGNVIVGDAALVCESGEHRGEHRAISLLRVSSGRLKDGSLAVAVTVYGNNDNMRTYILDNPLGFEFDRETGIGAFSTRGIQYRIQPLETLNLDKKTTKAG